jgi:hypothetical protein
VRIIVREFLAVLFVVSAVSVAQARTGETLDECKARYEGPAGQVAPDQFIFKQSHVTIIVHLRDGRSIQEDFAPESGGVLSETEMAEFLQANSEGSTWEITSETPTYISYYRKDGRATAQKAKPNTSNVNGGNVKLTVTGAELIIRYTAAAAANR